MLTATGSTARAFPAMLERERRWERYPDAVARGPDAHSGSVTAAHPDRGADT